MKEEIQALFHKPLLVGWEVACLEKDGPQREGELTVKSSAADRIYELFGLTQQLARKQWRQDSQAP